MQTPQPPLSERVSHALQRSPHLSGHHLRPRTRDGRVVLHGAVNTFFQKQMAQEAIRRVEGVQGIANELVVVGEAPARKYRVHL